jgi:glycine/D-amino acid oxidase-like deaminating enzyme
MDSTPFWTAGSEPAGAEPIALPARADVAIIGGGYTGVAAARALALSGIDAVLLEREALGWGASTRNGGFVLPGFKRSLASLERSLGPERTHELFRESLAAVDLVEKLVEQEGIRCGYQRAGHLTLAETPAQLGRLEKDGEYLGARFDCTTTILGRSGIGDEIGSSKYCGALLDRSAGRVQPAELFQGLRLAADRAGARMLPFTAVHRIERGPASFELLTSRGRMRAGLVIIATNGYSGPANPELQARIVPVGSHLIATQPLGHTLATELIPRGRVLNDSRHLLHYFRLSDDQRLLFGGRAAFRPSGAGVNEQAAIILRRDMVEIFPQLGNVAIEHTWSGNVGFTRDQMPHVSRFGGVISAGGYCGHGVAMAIYVGDRIGRHLAGRDSLPLQAGGNFPRIPLYSGRPWFLPLVGTWYRMLDGLSAW